MCRRPDGFPVMRQRWSGLLFLHWPVDPDLIAARLPRGLHVDTFDGTAWLGVVPFFMDRIRPVLLPPVPGISWFLELNVRTYVHDSHGNPGVWFFSLDCNQPLAVEVARRAFHLPYQHAAMKAHCNEGVVDYQCHRDGGIDHARFEYHLPLETRPAEYGTLVWFLVERYLLFSADARGHLHTGRVHHAPYRIAPAIHYKWSAAPLQWNGFNLPPEPPHSALAADPVDVRVFPLRRT